MNMRGLAGKLIGFVVVFVLCIGCIFMAMSYSQVRHLDDVVAKESTAQSDLVRNESSKAMSDLTERSLYQLNIWAADKTDDEFWILDHDMRVLRTQVEDVFRHPDNYEPVDVYPPQKSDGGVMTLQLLVPGGREPDAGSMDIIRRLANLAPMMEEIVRGNEGYALDCYISIPDGTTLVMDDLSDKKFDEDGKIIDYDPTVRPWYQGAVRTGDVFFSQGVKSAFYDFNEVVFGAPVYVDGELVAVIEGSTGLDILETKMDERTVDYDSFSILVTDEGQLLCSSRKYGELGSDNVLKTGIRNEINDELGQLLDRALAGETGIARTVVDGEYYYAAYAPVETVGWSQITFASEKEILAPAHDLGSQIDESYGSMVAEIDSHFGRSSVFMLVLLLLIMCAAIAFASFMARKRVAPINRMTRAVGGFISDDMSFEMEDIYRTGDEIEELAESFETMSVRMKHYLEEIIEHTAEKERLATEMESAKKIQMKMLPSICPGFSGRPEYELYAETVPARNVGGDLYDFFYLDEDHLVIMIGDVSGKGITVALFMVLCKQMIRSMMVIHGGDVVEAITEANKRLREESVEGMFVTVWLGVITLSTGVMDFVDGGHMYAAVRRKDGEFRIEEDEHSILVAALDKARFKLNTMNLHAGDTIYLYTDGVTESCNADGDMFGEERMLSALNERGDLPVDELDGLVRKRISEFVGDAEQYDDLTTLCFRYKYEAGTDGGV